jgi:hypothetical protein
MVGSVASLAGTAASNLAGRQNSKDSLDAAKIAAGIPLK